MKPERDELIPTRWTLIQRLKNWTTRKAGRSFLTPTASDHGTAIKSGLTEVEAQDLCRRR